MDQMEEFKSKMLRLDVLSQDRYEQRLREVAYAEGVASERIKWIDACNESEHDSNGMIIPEKLFDILGLKWKN